MHDAGAADERGRSAGADAELAAAEAVERFVERHACGQAPDPLAFVALLPQAVRPAALAQIREFLAFDGLVGQQEWRGDAPAAGGGRRIGDFAIEGELGRGGMGVVYLARQVSLNRRVALKVMASGLALSKRHVERFRREAAAAAQVRHPAIVPVHSFAEVEGTLAFAMDYVAGRNLADILDDLRLENVAHPGEVNGTLGIAAGKGYVAECAMLCAQIASALAAAHAAGVVHRDLKPRNLMLDEHRQVRLLDFGLAKSLNEGSISLSGEITGTVHYMSPEQTLAKRVAVDHRSDVFSLGVILYELLTLRRPFEGRNLQQIVYEICFAEPRPPTHWNRKVPRDLATICGKALEKEPHNRYATAAEFEADLRRFLSWEPILARPAGPLTRLGKFLRRKRAEAIGAGVAVLVLAAALVWSSAEAADRSRRAEVLLGDAAAAAAAGDLRRAMEQATVAVGLRNDPATRELLSGYTLAWTTEQRDIAEAALLANLSGQQTDRNRELAMQLALTAHARRASATTRTAVLDALGAGHRVVELDGDGQEVQGLRWSPDGAAIVGTTRSGAVLLWEPANGAVAARLLGHRGAVLDATFAPGGGVLATASADQTLRLWNPADGTERANWPLPGAVSTIAYDGAGARVLVATYGATGPYRAEVRDAAAGAVLGGVAHPRHVVAAALSPSGELAASWGGDGGDVLLWEAATGRVTARLGGHGDRVTQIQFAPDGSSVATACRDGGVRWFATATGRTIATGWHSLGVDTLAFGEAGRWLATGARDHTARLWQLERDGDGDAGSMREVRTFLGHGGAVTGVAFAPRGQLLATACRDGIVRVFEARAGDAGGELQRHEAGGAIAQVAFDPDGRRLLVRAGLRRLLVWDLAHNLGVSTLRQPGKVPAACFDERGERIATAGDEERVRLWSARDGRQLWVSESLDQPVQALDVRGGRIACTTVGGTLAILDLDTGAVRSQWPAHQGRSPRVRWLDDERVLTAGAEGARGAVVVWNVAARKPTLRLERPLPVTSADIDPAGTLLATVDGGESFARLWRLPDLEPAGESVAHEQELSWLCWRPDGGALLTASLDGTARLGTTQGRALATFDAGRPLQHVAFSPDGAHVLTSAADAAAGARIWRAIDGAELLSFQGHRQALTWGAFSPDGTRALTASLDGTARIWPTDPVAAAERLQVRPLTDAELRRLGLTGAASTTSPARSPSTR